ncbi:MAG TPA: sigma-54 dependent transcriptional regulator [Dissulfurispiraceae bacterium]|nr:sigma-54 dependent transcriptional regulator [Dissulfurispiraceae bacterium]
MKILLIEDEPSLRFGLEHFLSGQGHDVVSCADGDDGAAALLANRFDLVLTDLRMPKKDGFAILKMAKEIDPSLGVVLMTAYADVKDAVRAIKEGAFDYLSKPFSNEEVAILVERFAQFRRLEHEVRHLREKLGDRDAVSDLIGESAPMKNVIARIEAVAATDSPVLITGESGTGKELVANAVHALSHRKESILVKINCAAIPANLFESELFGFVKGAFTGASETRKGKFEFASGGTIFFDEIADVPLSLQPKLLRVLEEGKVTRLGDNIPRDVDVRSIYATSKNLKDLVAAGSFREDLYYRINVAPITLPPLRARPEDLPYLIDFFVRKFAQQMNKGVVIVEPDAQNAFLSYHYPGNVRELKHAIESAMIFSQDGVIRLQNLPDEIAAAHTGSPCLTGNLTLGESLRCLERYRIARALEVSAGKKQDAAKMLGIGRKALWKKMKDYGID